VGAGTQDDAAVYRLSEDVAIVQTVDVFTPVVDDPYAYGAIAAANSLSDVYAMGARPMLALNVLAYPQGRLPMDVVARIVRGGTDKMQEAGVAVGGGHSLDDPQPKFGYAVTGIARPDRIVTNAGARPGDRLVLTKPLGIGVITTGIKRERSSEAAVEAATRVMLELNRAASEAMVEVGVHACTDVTGYGLLGHLHEMGAASRVDARVWLSAVPILEAAWDLVRERVVPGGTYRNRRAAQAYVRWHPEISEEAQLLLCDAQTSGGLLMALPSDRVASLRDALGRRGVRIAAEIGEIVDWGEGRIEVVP
jgi:selenide,water dikinase